MVSDPVKTLPKGWEEFEKKIPSRKLSNPFKAAKELRRNMDDFVSMDWERKK